MLNTAITLIALIITIIVLLILAAVTLNMVIGENGIFNKAKKSTEEIQYAQELEAVQLAVLSAKSNDTNASYEELFEALKNDSNYNYIINTQKQLSSISSEGSVQSIANVPEETEIIYVIPKEYEFGIDKELNVIEPENKNKYRNDGEDTAVIGDKVSSDLFETEEYDKTKNVFDYNKGARVTYVTNPNKGSTTAINGGCTGDSSPIGNTSGFWNASNGWNHQGCVENDASIDNVTYNHNGNAKSGSSATTLNGGSDTKQIIIIDPRAYYGDTQNYTFEIDDLYLASANSNGNVGNYSIYISNGGADVATNPDDSSWTSVTSGNLTEDWKLIKVYSGNLKFKYIKLELYSRDKSWMELAAIKGFKRICDSTETKVSVKREENKLNILAANQNVGIKEVKIIDPNGNEKKIEYNNFGICKNNYKAKQEGTYKIVVTDKNNQTKELEFEITEIYVAENRLISDDFDDDNFDTAHWYCSSSIGESNSCITLDYGKWFWSQYKIKGTETYINVEVEFSSISYSGTYEPELYFADNIICHTNYGNDKKYGSNATFNESGYSVDYNNFLGNLNADIPRSGTFVFNYQNGVWNVYADSVLLCSFNNDLSEAVGCPVFATYARHDGVKQANLKIDSITIDIQD